jgi:hypothetical protein
MNFKQFLKPDRRKIVIFVIINIILLIPLISFSCIFCQATAPVDILMKCGNDHYNLPWETSVYCGKPYKLTSILIAIYYPSIFIATLIITYLLSCLIVWIYDKVKKKK